MLYSSPMGPLFRRARLQPCDKFPIMQSSRPKLGILAEKINNLMENQEYYDELLNTTLVDKQRSVFDWGEGMVKVVEKIMSLKNQNKHIKSIYWKTTTNATH